MTVKCAICKTRPCREGITDKIKLPSFCPIKNHKSLIEETTQKYRNQDIKEFFLNAALTEKECYDEKMAKEEGKIRPLRPRIKKISEFAKKIGAKKTWHGILQRPFCMKLTGPMPSWKTTVLR